MVSYTFLFYGFPSVIAPAFSTPAFSAPPPICGERTQRSSGGSALQTTGAAMVKLRWSMDAFVRDSNKSPRHVAAPAIDKVGPIGPTIFVWALPWALPLGQETKNVTLKSPLKFSKFNHMTFASVADPGKLMKLDSLDRT